MIEKRLQEFVSCLNKRPEKIFVISDTHFNHPAMLECETERLIYQGSYESFEDFVIDNWNQRVSKDDFVIHLGDYIFSEPERFYEQYRANGRIVLIRGNHDRDDILSVIREKLFLVISDLFLIKRESNGFSAEVIKEKAGDVAGLISEICGKKILFSHYPVYEYDEYDANESAFLRNIYKKYRCNLNIHGHVHNRLEVHTELVNVSIDRTDYMPKRLSDILRSLP